MNPIQQVGRTPLTVAEARRLQESLLSAYRNLATSGIPTERILRSLADSTCIPQDVVTFALLPALPPTPAEESMVARTT